MLNMIDLKVNNHWRMKIISLFAAMAPSKKVLATVSRGQLPSFCRIGRGGCNNLALGFTGGSCREKQESRQNIKKMENYKSCMKKFTLKNSDCNIYQGFATPLNLFVVWYLINKCIFYFLSFRLWSLINMRQRKNIVKLVQMISNQK